MGVRRVRIPRPIGAVAVCLLLWVAAGAHAAESLRVGTSGDYPPFSEATGPGSFAGLSIELARRYAADRGLELELVRFRWPRLLADLEADRFDVAMSGITVRPERSARAIFTLPVAETGAVVLVKPETWSDPADLDRQQIRIAVNLGGHLERVAAEQFPRATRIAVPDNASVLTALVDDAVQAVVTDSVEARVWLERQPELVALGPLTHDRKALLVRRERPELATDLDRWLLERELDGSLEALRIEYLGPGPWRPVARPFEALLAAIDERLSLMPTVARVKRDSGEPLEVPEREYLVIDRATRRVLEAAQNRDAVPPSVLLIGRFFRAQLEAAKQIQRDAVADPDFAIQGEPPDLDADLRPALLHIGDRIAWLIVSLDGEVLEPVQVMAAVQEQVHAPYLARSSKRAIAEALAVLVP